MTGHYALKAPSRAGCVVVGGGIMGADVAFLLLRAQCKSVDIVEPNQERHSFLADYIKQNAIDFDIEERLSHLNIITDLSQANWSDIDLVIECAPEVLSIKKSIFTTLEKLSLPNTILASNSSSFPISDIAEGLVTAGRMVGLHFFMPAHIVPLVEVVKGKDTDDEAAKALYAFMKRCGSVPILAHKDLPGFVANRLQHALAREAYSLIQANIVSPEDIDAAVRFGFGFRYLAAGPILQKEHGGIDVHAAAAATIYPSLSNVAIPPESLSGKVKEGKIGMKSGEGFYKWNEQDMAAEKARYQSVLKAGLNVLVNELPKIEP